MQTENPLFQSRASLEDDAKPSRNSSFQEVLDKTEDPMSLAILLLSSPNAREICHRSTPQSIKAEAYLSDLSKKWRKTLPHQSTIPSYISPDFKAYGDYIPQGISYEDYLQRAQKNVFSMRHLKHGLGGIRATVDSKARRADVYIMSWMQGFDQFAENDVRRPAVTVLRWLRSGDEWLLYECVGITGNYLVFDDP